MRPSRLETNNVTVCGNPEAERTVVFAHGFGIDQHSWRFLTPGLEDSFRLVLYDVMGCGNSDITSFSQLRYGSLDGHALDLIEICDALAITGVSVIAHSFSCMTAALAHLRRPDLFGRFVWIGGSPCYQNDDAYRGGLDRAALDAIYQAFASDFLGWMRGLAAAATKNPERPELAAEFSRSLASMRPDIAMTLARTFFQMDLRREMKRLNLPVLVLQPDDDPFVPIQVGQFLQATLPQGELCVIHAQGHFPQLSHPQDVLGAMSGFV